MPHCAAGSPESLEIRLFLTFDPTGQEQELLEDINRMRQNPQGELNYLFTSTNPLVSPDPAVNSAMSQFGVNSGNFLPAWQTLTPVAPLIWNESLYNVANQHNQLMLQADTQSHQLPGEGDLNFRFELAGYTGFSNIGENIYAYSQSVFHGHSGLAIDWGNPGLGHRINMMSPDFREFGGSVIGTTDPSKTVGLVLITEDFGNRFLLGDPFITGVVYNDLNHDGRYQAGEGLGGVNITTSAGYNTTTMSAGGYQVQVQPGTYSVTASGGGLAQPRVLSNVVVGNSNAKADLSDALNVVPAHVRMYRAYNPNADLHVFTTSAAEFQFITTHGLIDETTGQPGFSVWNTPQPGTTAIHRMYNPNTGEHYYTLSTFERDFLVQQGWNYEKDEGYMYASEIPGTTEIFRLYNTHGGDTSKSGEHFFTEDVTQKNEILRLFPGIWEQHSSLGFAFAVAANSSAVTASQMQAEQLGSELSASDLTSAFIALSTGDGDMFDGDDDEVGGQTELGSSLTMRNRGR